MLMHEHDCNLQARAPPNCVVAVLASSRASACSCCLLRALRLPTNEPPHHQPICRSAIACRSRDRDARPWPQQKSSASMEIERAVRGSSDARLRAKYDAAVYIIRRAYALYSFEELAFSFNGGKDSTVLLHLLRAGYYLHRASSGHVDSTVQTVKNCPMRTIYFEDPNTFPEIDCFTYETASTYGLPLETIRTDYKSGLEALLKEKPTKAIFLGTRNGDPNAVGQQEFSPSSPGWPSFMRVNPILDWSYSDVWSFLLTCKAQYCILYDQGYTSIGSIHNTVPNKLLRDGSGGYRPAYTLSDGSLERAGRANKAGKKKASVNGRNSNDPRQRSKL